MIVARPRADDVGMKPRSQRLRTCAIGALVVMAVACGEAGVDVAAPDLVESVVAPPPPVTLRIGAFSAATEALGVRVLPAFALHWRRLGGQRVSFVETYDGSGSIAQAVWRDFDADVLLFALTEDVQDLVRRRLIAPTWRERPHQGIVCRSLVALAVRKGNPKAIHDWPDLVRPGVAIVSSDPSTSGCGMWNLCALYGAALRGHAGVEAGDPEIARRFVTQVWGNVVAGGESAREAFKTFQSGVGDVAIIYESEIINARMFGHSDERVIPRSTLLVESPIVVVDRNADSHGVRAVAEGLLQFLWTPKIQAKLAFCGLRPVDPDVFAAASEQFPQPADLWTIADLGGWEEAIRAVGVPAAFGAVPRPGK